LASLAGVWHDPTVGAVKSEKREREYLAVRALLREVFDKDLYVGHHSNGQPFLRNQTDRITISHTRRFAVVLTHPHRDVGVDIESLDRDFSAVEHRALSDREIASLSQKERSLHLAILWSAKEALYKCVLQEGVDFAAHIEVEPFVPQESGTLCARFRYKDNREAHFSLKYKIFDNHILVYIFA